MVVGLTLLLIGLGLWLFGRRLSPEIKVENKPVGESRQITNQVGPKGELFRFEKGKLTIIDQKNKAVKEINFHQRLKSAATISSSKTTSELLIEASTEKGETEIWRVKAESDQAERLALNILTANFLENGSVIGQVESLDGGSRLVKIGPAGDLKEQAKIEEDFPIEILALSNQEILFTSEPSELSGADLYRLDLERGEANLLKNYFGIGPILSPDKKFVAFGKFDRNDNDYRLSIFDIEREKLALETKIAFNRTLVDWLPDGRSLIIGQEQKLVKLDLDGGLDQLLKKTPDNRPIIALDLDQAEGKGLLLTEKSAFRFNLRNWD